MMRVRNEEETDDEQNEKEKDTRGWAGMNGVVGRREASVLGVWSP